ncbi:MAG: tRNA guanosine(34) transglycosylase Tgt [Acidimicrobiales bacterium]|jgi:queuine tRNA-ribosyltransferase|nr:tRNA guanosine(34) transglycosylase Tgt [Acidimicrobiales bacterium]MDP6298045.1 tRNA guanosine(34) transglycosylase Tgt [Acidimicrobiales bacterium]HJM28902.1 tRNA guanosine(34) transglycosylase Tgt [Acidimicrobiales bacterium]HJM97829.1 tRNA guanosine(34) transglycosylase Tgt [Acidimicrobiales bacterium]
MTFETTLRFSVLAKDGDARVCELSTDRHVLQTPIFMPVGTRGSVRTITSEDLEELGADIILGNTYHLMLRPGAELVNQFGGLHGFSNWKRLILTDSGGYQVFSLEPDVDDDGVTFKSTYDGSFHRLTPEIAVELQNALGSDIQMALDVCPPLPAKKAVVKLAADRTHKWALRARRHFLNLRNDQPGDRAQFGIVQGGLDLDLRKQSAEQIVGIGFDGYAIGGLSVGETREEMLEPMYESTKHIPLERPRYFMGLGDPAGLVEAISSGIDMFDCVWPTRLARHGTALTMQGRINLSAARYAKSDGPIDPEFTKNPTSQWSRGYIRHLLSVGEPVAGRILTLHNLAWTFDFMRRARESIINGQFMEFRKKTLEIWG